MHSLGAETSSHPAIGGGSVVAGGLVVAGVVVARRGSRPRSSSARSLLVRSAERRWPRCQAMSAVATTLSTCRRRTMRKRRARQPRWRRRASRIDHGVERSLQCHHHLVELVVGDDERRRDHDRARHGTGPGWIDPHVAAQGLGDDLLLRDVDLDAVEHATAAHLDDRG